MSHKLIVTVYKQVFEYDIDDDTYKGYKDLVDEVGEAEAVDFFDAWVSDVDVEKWVEVE